MNASDLLALHATQSSLPQISSALQPLLAIASRHRSYTSHLTSGHIAPGSWYTWDAVSQECLAASKPSEGPPAESSSTSSSSSSSTTTATTTSSSSLTGPFPPPTLHEIASVEASLSLTLATLRFIHHRLLGDSCQQVGGADEHPVRSCLERVRTAMKRLREKEKSKKEGEEGEGEGKAKKRKGGD